MQSAPIAGFTSPGLPPATTTPASGAATTPAAAPAATSGKRPRVLRRILSLRDLEPAAKRRLPRPIFGYVSGAAEDNRSLGDNATIFDDYLFSTRVLIDVSQRSQEVELLGRRYSSPFGIAPMGIVAMSAYRGDVVLARAAKQAGIPSIMSGASLIPLETVAQAAPGTWFQAYLTGDTNRNRALIDRVARAGFETLVVTVDLPVAGNRENNYRNGFATPLRPSPRLAWDGLIRPRWLLENILRTLLNHGMPHFENSYATRGAPIISAHVQRDFTARDVLNWDHLKAIRAQWQGPLVVKGILSVEDARLAREHGADALILSNHGGRQLDGAISAMRVLPAVVDALGDYPVMVDGGFRRGADVLKALALGARMVFIGRPFNYAAAIASDAGVAHAIWLLREEIDRNMAMIGVTRCGQIGREHLVEARSR